MRLLLAIAFLLSGMYLVTQPHWLAQTIGTLFGAIGFLVLASFPINEQSKRKSKNDPRQY